MNKIQINCPFCDKQMFINADLVEFMCPFCGEPFIKEDYLRKYKTNPLSLQDNRTLRIPMWFDFKYASKEQKFTSVECDYLEKPEFKEPSLIDTTENNYNNHTKENGTIIQTQQIQKSTKLQLPDISKIKIGSLIKFGRYPQNRDTTNEKEDIEWLVLEKEEDKILVISDKAIDCQRYNTEFTDVTWEDCTLRKWLNGTFLNNAFSEEEQEQILNTTVSADKNPSYSTNPGNDTTDKVFLLSITEAEKYFTSNGDRKCVPTEYAIAQGAYTRNSDTKGGKATCWWWLRSPGYYQTHAAYVSLDGSVDYGGDYVYYVYDCVRPALWIKLES